LISHKACKWWCKYIYFLIYSNSPKVFFLFFLHFFDMAFTINYLYDKMMFKILFTLFCYFPYLSNTKIQKWISVLKE